MALRNLTMTAAALALMATAAFAQDDFYSGYPHEITNWSATYFEPSEFASKGNGKVRVSREMIEALDRVRAAVGHPLRITSGYRDPEHNARVGGAKHSRHMVGDAVDIDISRLNEAQRYTLMWHLLAEGFTSFGSYAGSTFIHADMRPKACIWRHGGGEHPAWFRKALSDWGWVRDHGATNAPRVRYAAK